MAETVLFEKRLERTAGFADHLDQQVVTAGYPEHVNDFAVFAEPMRDRARRGRVRHLDADHRVGLVADCHRIGERDDLERAALLHRLHAVADGAFRDLEFGGDVLVGQAPVLLQHLDDGAVEIVLGGGDAAALAGVDGYGGFAWHFVVIVIECRELLMKNVKYAKKITENVISVRISRCISRCL